VLAAAAREPRTLVIGLDASAAAMAEASRRAAGPARKGGLPNAAFVLAAAEAMPEELCGVAQLVTVQFPWGSLLRGCVGGDERVAAGIAGLLAPNGRLQVLLAPSVRDGLDGVPVEADELAAAVRTAFARHSLELDVARPATEAEVVASGSSWARRLRSQRPEDRAVMLMRRARPIGVAAGVGGSTDGRERR
jgi:16S rRNA (adenine(1408)-N(1))-methyltransferase